LETASDFKAKIEHLTLKYFIAERYLKNNSTGSHVSYPSLQML